MGRAARQLADVSFCLISEVAWGFLGLLFGFRILGFGVPYLNTFCGTCYIEGTIME